MSRTILMLEHDDDDRYITQTVFDEHSYEIKFHFAANGAEMFAHLDSCDVKKLPLPSLILLNYHAGPSNAVPLIQKLKGSNNYHHIPIVVLSGSVSTKIIMECYDAGASSFIQKPANIMETEAKISSFFHYWFKTVELP